jgi:hypothetical protein
MSRAGEIIARAVRLLAAGALCGACDGSVSTEGDGTADGSGPCSSAEHYTASQLELDPEAYDGLTFVVEAPIYSSVACTEMGCPPENPCCNTCDGGYSFSVGDRHCDLEAPEGETWKCGGDECNVDCVPFGYHARSDPLEGLELLGTFTVVNQYRCEFRVTAVCD